jgi:hypothetical protein
MDQEWRSDAACRDVDPGVFFDAQTELAIAICRSCSVQGECLDFAVQLRITDGVWGGVDLGAETRETERMVRNKRAQRLRRQMRSTLPHEPACPQCEDNLGVFQIEPRRFRCIGCGSTWRAA